MNFTIPSAYRPGKLFFAVLLLVCSIFAIAQVSSDSPPLYTTPDGVVVNTSEEVQELAPGIIKTMTKDAIAAFKKVVKIANDAINAVRSNSQLRSYGERLTLMLTSIVVTWSIIKNVALKQSLPQLIGDLIFPLIIAGFVLSAGIGKLPDIIDSSTKAVAGIFSSVPLESMEIGLATGMFEAMANVWDADKAGSGILSFMDSPIVSVAMLLLRIGVIFLMLVAAGLGVAAILVAKFQMALAIALAPLLIPWIVFKPTEFLFSGWLNFFLKAGFGLVGIFAVSAVVIAGSRGMASMVSTTNSDVAGVMTFVVMAAMSIIFTYLMLKGADIGEGIISGSATGIGQLTSVAKGSAASSPAKMAGAALTGGGAVAKGGLAAAAGKAVGSGKLSTGAESAASKAFGKSGTVARTVFESTRGGNGKSQSSSPSTPPPAAPQRTSLAQKLRERQSK